jgi:hypothetical protein
MPRPQDMTQPAPFMGGAQESRPANERDRFLPTTGRDPSHPRTSRS